MDQGSESTIKYSLLLRPSELIGAAVKCFLTKKDASTYSNTTASKIEDPSAWGYK